MSRKMVLCVFTSSSSCSWASVGLTHLSKMWCVWEAPVCFGEGKYWVLVRDPFLACQNVLSALWCEGCHHQPVSECWEVLFLLLVWF